MEYAGLRRQSLQLLWGGRVKERSPEICSKVDDSHLRNRQVPTERTFILHRGPLGDQACGYLGTGRVKPESSVSGSDAAWRRVRALCKVPSHSAPSVSFMAEPDSTDST